MSLQLQISLASAEVVLKTVKAGEETTAASKVKSSEEDGEGGKGKEVKRETPFKCNGLNCKKIVIRTESSSVSFCPKCIDLKLSSEMAVYCSRDCFGSAMEGSLLAVSPAVYAEKEKER